MHSLASVTVTPYVPPERFCMSSVIIPLVHKYVLLADGIVEMSIAPFAWSHDVLLVTRPVITGTETILSTSKMEEILHPLSSVTVTV